MRGIHYPLMHAPTRVALALLAVTVLTIPGTLQAESELPFPDVAATDPAFDAITALKVSGIIQGYRDGSFRPEHIVTRAEAVKMIVTVTVKEADLKKLTTSPYTDIPADAWHLPFVEAARKILGILDGPPQTMQFHPERSVNLSEFLKILELAYGVDPQSAFSDLRMPLASDLRDTGIWHYPYLRYALASSMIRANGEGFLHPEEHLTRGKVALLLYRYSMFREGRRLQALAATVENEIQRMEHLLAADQTSDALLASARAVLASRGALTAAPNNEHVKSWVKLAEGFHTAAQGEDALEQKKFDEALRLAGDAWHLAAKALEFDLSQSALSKRLQALSTLIADAARAKKKGA